MANAPPPVPTRSPMLNSDGTATRPWIAWFTTLGQLFGFNQTIKSGGIAVPQELALNFLAPLIVTDNPSNGSTDVSLPPAAFSLQFGEAQVAATGTDIASVDVMFPSQFSVIPKVFVNPTDFPRAGNEPMSCYATGVTETGFTANLACSVPTGGGGATINNIINVDWVAIA